MSEARMQETAELKPGAFCWVELGTTNGEEAKKFYTKLFGWGFNDIPIGPNEVYTILTLNDKSVGALYQLNTDMKAQGIPPHWLSYVSVTSADETAQKSKHAGGTLMKEPFDVFDLGRMGKGSNGRCFRSLAAWYK
jgi:predicted enzyme related to lactoylglutathione lyase